MKKFGKSNSKVYVDNTPEDIGEFSSTTDEELERLPVGVQNLLASLSIPYGPQFGKGSDVDPTLGLLNHIIDSVAALRDVVKVYKKKESEFAVSVGTRIVTALTGEIGKMLIYSLTNDWEGHESTAGCFHVISTRILSTFPEIATRQHKVSGKMLIHHTCYKSSSKHTLEYVNALLSIVPSSASCADAHGAIPLHWSMRNKNATTDMLRTLVQAFTNGPRTKDKKGFLPLHWAVHQENPRYDLIECLLRMYPAAAREPCESGGLPLHWAVNQDSVSLDVVKLLVKTYPEALNTPCSAGWLPIHRAVDRSHPNLPALKFLLEQFPRGLQRPCNDGQLPLHKVVDHAPTSFDAFTMVLDGFPNATQVGDRDGYMPLHMAIDCPAPSIDVVKRLVDDFPGACRRPTLDGLLPLHLAVSTVGVPSLQVIELLVAVYPLAAQHMAVDNVPSNEAANPDTWEGEWIEKKWTPLSRAIDRRLHDIVAILKSGLSGNGAKGKSSKQSLSKFNARRPDSMSSFDSSLDSYGYSESESSQSNIDSSVDAPPKIITHNIKQQPAQDFEMSDDSELESKGSGSKRNASGSRKLTGTSRFNGKFRIQIPKMDAPKDPALAVRTSPLYDRIDGSGNASANNNVANSMSTTTTTITPRRSSGSRAAPPPTTESPYTSSQQAVVGTEILTSPTSATGPTGDADDASVETHVRMIAPKSTIYSKFSNRPNIVSTAISAKTPAPTAPPTRDDDQDLTPPSSRNIVVRQGLVNDSMTVSFNRPNSAADALIRAGAVPLQARPQTQGTTRNAIPHGQTRQMVEELV